MFWSAIVLEYHAAYYQLPGDDGWFLVRVLDFPGVASQGKTLKSARRMILDALREMVQWHLEEGQPLPQPKARTRDRKAVFLEGIRVDVRLRTEVHS
jgi:predicted RNase H-like HicB family nuclease